MSDEKTKSQVLIVAGYDKRLPKQQRHGHRPLTYKRLREIRRDPTVRLARALIIAPILASPWSFEETAKAPDGAQEFIREILEAMRLRLLMTASLGCIDFGWQPYEKVFSVTDDGRTSLKKLKPLLHDKTYILVDENGAITGLEQPDDGVVLDITSALVISIDVEGTDWYGQSQLEIADSPCKQWEDVDEAANRYDTKLAGAHWLVKYPPGTSIVDGVETDNYQVAKTLLESMKASGGAVVPADESTGLDKVSGFSVELISAQAAQASFVARQSYIDKLKVRAIGLPERSILEGEFGTKAEASVHADLAITNMELRHLLIVQHINWHLVNQLLRLNYGPRAENSVSIVPMSLTDLQREWMQTLYTTILANDNGFLMEYDNMDLPAMRDKLGIPEKEAQVLQDAAAADAQPA